MKIMCGFMLYTKKDIKREEFEREFSKISYRGLDMTNIIDDQGIFGFSRLAIMGFSESGM